VKYKKSPKTIRKYFDNLLNEEKISENNGEALNVVFDTTFFDKELALMLFRGNSKNLHWEFTKNETVLKYQNALIELEKKYYFLSFTIDGKKGVIQMLENTFKDTPIQFCHFHQCKIITQYITQKPKTECGKELKYLMIDLKRLTKEQFIIRFQNIQTRYEKFIKEKNENNEFKHRRMRSAIRSIKTNLDYLFTFDEYPELKIPKTTNSCDGYFSHLKAKVSLHRGISHERKKKLIEELLIHDFYEN
jgi:transposase-like protein